MKQLCLLFSFLCCAVQLFGQKLLLLDDLTDMPIPNVHVYNENSQEGTYSDSLGLVNLEAIKLSEAIVCSHIAYETKRIDLPSFQDTLVLRLMPAFTLLPEASVSAIPKMDTIFEEPYSIIDYVAVDDYLLLLGFRSAKEGRLVILMDLEENVLDRKVINRGEKLHHNCKNELLVETRNTLQRIEIDYEKIILKESIPLRKYREFLDPCLFRKNLDYYFAEYYFNQTIIRYFSLNLLTGKQNPVILVSDDKAINRLDLNSRWRFTRHHAIPDQVLKIVDRDEALSAPEILPLLRYQHKAIEDRPFDFFEKPIAAPLYNLGDSLYLFNFPESRLEVYDLNYEKIREEIILFHKEKSFTAKIIQDYDQGKLYARFIHKGKTFLKEIDCLSGKTEQTIPIPGNYVTHLQIHRNELYFLYKHPFDKQVMKKIYRIKME